MANNDSRAVPPLTKEQEARVAQLSSDMLDEIDNVILSNTDSQWKQVAIVVALSMGSIAHKQEGVPAAFYIERIKEMSSGGVLEIRGELEYMRSSEVRKL